MKHVDENYKISIFLKENKGNLLANATVSVDTLQFGYITIKGFQIWISRIFNERLQDKINIQPPTKLAYGRAHQQVFIEDKQKWFLLELEIYNLFLKSKEPNIHEEEEIDIDEIDKALSS